MPGNPEKDDENWFRPPWETDDEESLEPPGPPRTRKPPVEPDYDHPLLPPLARAQDAVTRLETRMQAASEAVADGLRARMSYLEAAGWLRHAYIGIHPWDLALRDHGVTTSYGVAAHGDRLETALPSTVAQESGLDVAPSVVVRLDIEVNQALRLARLWRQLGERRTWRPLADTDAVRKTLQSLGCGVFEEGVVEDWLAGVQMTERGPLLIRAGHAALDWMDQPGVKERGPDALFLVACLWRDKGRPIALPFWSAPEQHHHRLSLQFGLAWMAEFLECVTAAAMVGLRELERLLQVEEKGRLLAVTARSRLPHAVDAMIRTPIVSARSLAKALDVTPQAGLGLLEQLTAAGIAREASGRASWRVFGLV
jgi:hypothetical protein